MPAIGTVDFKIYRRRYGRGFRPHLSLLIDDIPFHIDSSPGEGYNLITHAHSDHHGQRNVSNGGAVASIETARILEVVTKERFEGRMFEVGDKLHLSGVKVETYPTYHIHGSAAFHFVDHDILVTGDVKDYRDLPECSFLITEATYGHPKHVFEEEIDRLVKAASAGAALGAYPIGKAQRVAEILLENGVDFTAERKIAEICRALGIEHGHSGSRIVSPRRVYEYGGYILTAQNFYRCPRITLSDHLDYRGIVEMVHHCNPEIVIFYHGRPSKHLLDELERDGFRCLTLKDFEKY